MKSARIFIFLENRALPIFSVSHCPHLVFVFPPAGAENNGQQIKDHFSHPKEIDNNSFIRY